MRINLTAERKEELGRLTYDATIPELADIIFVNNRTMEVEQLIELLQQKIEKEKHEQGYAD